MIDPHVWQCAQCGWTGDDDGKPVRNHQSGDLVCPQCRALGFNSRVEKIALADLPPKGSQR